ncbi:hypothetical protein GGS26DRAFT_352851 [Hypomontagnella submonticulosa]|nr:hypothetical protein GGS26DRAFT_352851 [Hypomontagnella submonticulosa]
MYDGSRIPHFNPDTNALEWNSTGRWATKSWREPCPLFLAACLSVRYVSVEYDRSMCVQLEDLVLALLDPCQPLETLTISGIESHPSFHVKYPRYRLARTPPGPRYFLEKEADVEELDAILSRRETCFLPWEGLLRSESGPAQGVKNDYSAQIREEKQKQRQTPPDEPRIDLWPWLSIYQVAGPDERKGGLPRGGFNWRSNEDRVAGALTKQFRDGGPVDTLCWLRILLANHHTNPFCHSIPCHGFCRSGYGLPATH